MHLSVAVSSRPVGPLLYAFHTAADTSRVKNMAFLQACCDSVGESQDGSLFQMGIKLYSKWKVICWVICFSTSAIAGFSISNRSDPQRRTASAATVATAIMLSDEHWSRGDLEVLFFPRPLLRQTDLLFSNSIERCFSHEQHEPLSQELDFPIVIYHLIVSNMCKTV